MYSTMNGDEGEKKKFEQNQESCSPPYPCQTMKW